MPLCVRSEEKASKILSYLQRFDDTMCLKSIFDSTVSLNIFRYIRLGRRFRRVYSCRTLILGFRLVAKSFLRFALFKKVCQFLFLQLDHMYVCTCTCHRFVYFEFLPPNVILIDFFGAEVAAQLTKLTNFTTLNLMYVYTGR